MKNCEDVTHRGAGINPRFEGMDLVPAGAKSSTQCVHATTRVPSSSSSFQIAAISPSCGFSLPAPREQTPSRRDRWRRAGKNVVNLFRLTCVHRSLMRLGNCGRSERQRTLHSRHARPFPKSASDLDRVDTGLFPPGCLVTHAVHQAVMDAAQRDRELVAHLARLAFR